MAKTKTLADRVAYARGLSGLSQRALSARADLDPSHVRLIEEGKRETPQGETLVKIAHALGVATDWLITGVGPAPTKTQIAAVVTLGTEPTAKAG